MSVIFGFGLNLLLNLYSFFYFGLSLVSGTAWIYFYCQKKDLPPTFRAMLVPMACLFLWSTAWAICNSFLSPWTGYLFVFLKNPAIIVMGLSLTKLAFEFQGNFFPRWKSLSVQFLNLFGGLALAFNGFGFFFREIQFDPKMEFYVPVQSSEVFWIQLSILSIATALALSMFNTMAVLILKFIRLTGKKRQKVLVFLGGILTVLCLTILDILVDLNDFDKSTYIFFLTNITIIFTTIVVLSALNQESIPSSVGFKIMTFNVTILYLILSMVANFLFNRFRSDFLSEMNREKHNIRTQIETGNKHPFVYLSDIVFDTQEKFFNINKVILKETIQIHLHKPGFESFQLDVLANNRNGIFWSSDFHANNRHFIMAIPYLEYRKNIHQTVVWLTITLIFSLATVFLLYPLLHKTSIIHPLKRLLSGIRVMQSGNFNVEVQVTSKDEIGEISNSFNEMISIVRNARDNLEKKIEERTVSLNKTISELREAQEQLLQSERMSTLGKIAASVAHEINNPLAAIKGSVQFIKDSNFGSPSEMGVQELDQLAKELFNAKDLPRRPEVTNRFKRKREMTELFDSRGFPDPDSTADTCFDIGIEAIPQRFAPLLDSPEGRSVFLTNLNLFLFQYHLQIIETAVERASKIVFALKHYSFSGPKESQSIFSIKEGIESVLTMYSSIWKQGIEISLSAPKDPKVVGYPNELVQVWTNLIFNAIQACPKLYGKIQIRVEEKNGFAKVSIQDNGEGIPKDHQMKIFEPFFTTKELGLGTGLGLSIVKKIIEGHKGTIEVLSSPGQTEFTIFLPLAIS
ncbi:ATP-binding protein [Leptospira sp. 96542]|nr:ATP-binding protein [Leptospira sp. 96542]